MPRRSRVLLALLLVHLLVACGTTVPRDTAPLTFVVVRHAEKATDDPENPGLSAAGRARATALAERLRDAPLVAAYATEFRRTQQTAQPAAALHGVPVQAYFARGPAAEVAAQWRQARTVPQPAGTPAAAPVVLRPIFPRQRAARLSSPTLWPTKAGLMCCATMPGSTVVARFCR